MPSRPFSSNFGSALNRTLSWIVAAAAARDALETSDALLEPAATLRIAVTRLRGERSTGEVLRLDLRARLLGERARLLAELLRATANALLDLLRALLPLRGVLV